MIFNKITLLLCETGYSQICSSAYLFWVSKVQFGSQIDNLQLDDVLLIGERFGHLSQDVGGDFGDMLAVLANQPQDARSGHRHLIHRCIFRTMETVWNVKVGSLDQNATWMLSMSLAMCLMMSLCCSGCICRSFLITTTDSATTSSEDTQTPMLYKTHTKYDSTLSDGHLWLLHCISLFFTAFDGLISSIFMATFVCQRLW